MADNEYCAVQICESEVILIGKINNLYIADDAGFFSIPATENDILLSNYGRNRPLCIFRNENNHQPSFVHVLFIRSKYIIIL